MELSKRFQSGTRSHAEFEREFATAILDADRPVPMGLVGPDGGPCAKRFAVYRNNVVLGLCETLKAAFPAVHRIVGEDFFVAMARLYVVQEPPTSPIMLGYGSGFASFVASFEPAAELPYLSDVARLERAWVEAYVSEDAAPLDCALLGGVAPAERRDVILKLHPSLRLLRSAFPIIAIWQTNIAGGIPRPIDLAAGGDDVLIGRPDAEVEVRSLPPGGAVFIDGIRSGCTIARATEAALVADPRFDLSANLSGLFEANAVVGFAVASRFKLHPVGGTA